MERPVIIGPEDPRWGVPGELEGAGAPIVEPGGLGWARFEEGRGRQMTRRQWLAGGAAMAAGLAVGAGDAEAALQAQKMPHLNGIGGAGAMVRGQGIRRRGAVVEVRHNSVFPNQSYSPDSRKVLQMLSNFMVKLTGEATPLKAWTRMVGPGDKVGILVDPVGGVARRTRKALIDSVLYSLRKAGVLPNDIIVWCAYGRQIPTLGYNLNWKRPGIKFLGADQLGWDKRYKLAMSGGMFGSNAYLSKIVTTYCSHIINIATLEDHPIIGCQFCLAQQATSSISGGQTLLRYWGGARGIADVASWKIMQQRFMLHMVDGLAGTFNGTLGPWRAKMLIGGTDPVAVDRMTFAYLESKRRRSGVSLIAGTRRSPVHINHAALKGAGVASLQSIKHSKVVLR